MNSELMFGLILWLNLFFSATEGPPATPSKFSPEALQARRVEALQGLPAESALVAFVDPRSLQEHLAQTPAFQLLQSERFQELRPWLRQWMGNTGSQNKMESISDLRQLGEEFGPFGLILFAPNSDRWACFIDGLEASTEAARNELLQAALPRFRAIFRNEEPGGGAAWVGGRLVFASDPNDLRLFSAPTRPSLDQSPAFQSQAEELRGADLWLYVQTSRLEKDNTDGYGASAIAKNLGMYQFKCMIYTLAPGTNGLEEGLKTGYAHEPGSVGESYPFFDVVQLLDDGHKPIRGASHVPKSASLAWDIRLWDRRSDNITQLLNLLISGFNLGSNWTQFIWDCTGEVLVWFRLPQSGSDVPPMPSFLNLPTGTMTELGALEGSLLLGMPPEFTMDKLKSTLQKDGYQPVEEPYRGVPVLYVVASYQTFSSLLACTVQDGFLGMHGNAKAARSYIDARLDGKTLPAAEGSAEVLYLALDQLVGYESRGGPQTFGLFGNPQDQQAPLQQFKAFLAELGPSTYERRALEGQSVWTSRSAFGFGGHPFYSLMIFVALYQF